MKGRRKTICKRATHCQLRGKSRFFKARDREISSNEIATQARHGQWVGGGAGESW